MLTPVTGSGTQTDYHAEVSVASSSW